MASNEVADAIAECQLSGFVHLHSHPIDGLFISVRSGRERKRIASRVAVHEADVDELSQAELESKIRSVVASALVEHKVYWDSSLWC